MRKTSRSGDVADPIAVLSRMNLQEGDDERANTQKILENLKKEEERIVNKIYNEDQKVIDRLQTVTQKREIIKKHVEDYMATREMEINGKTEQSQVCSYERELEQQLSPITKWMQRKEVEQYEKLMAADGKISHTLQQMKLDLLKNEDGTEEEENYRKMMLRKFSEYEKLCKESNFS